jgi:Na+/H+ antiporter NhaD/arsenite permease-like protein
VKESVLIQPKRKIKIKWGILKKDIVLTISLLLAAASCLIQPPRMEFINFHVLGSLFNLMLVIKAFEQLRLLDKMAISLLNNCQNSKSVSTILILLCFFSSMFVTNDVALLTFVPLTIVIGKKANLPVMETIILQTIAANLGSSLTPMGNPQNLFIYSYYEITPKSFFTTVLVLAVLGISSLYFYIRNLPKADLKVEMPPLAAIDRKQGMIWGLVLTIIIASIFGFIHYQIAVLITLLTVLILNRKLLLKIDYLLLLTFICFFIFSGNISNSTSVQSVVTAGLNSSTSVYFSSILLSQLISNVPAAIFLSSFTTDWKPLLLGVNIGGLGTIVASLASVISYKLFIQSNPNEGKNYLIKFSIYNVSCLVVLSLIQYFILKI